MLGIVTWPRNRWSVFDELESLQSDMSRLFPDWRPEFGRHAAARRGAGMRSTYPLVNVWSSESGLVVDAELPGVDPKDVEISVVGDELTIRGKVNLPETAADATYYRRERPAGEFVRTLQLPFRAEAAAVKAGYKNGILRLNVPRAESEKPRKIEIEA